MPLFLLDELKSKDLSPQKHEYERPSEKPITMENNTDPSAPNR